MTPDMYLTALRAASEVNKASYALRIDGRPIYRRTLFLGIGVDVKRRKGEADRLAGAVLDLQQTLVKNCSQQLLLTPLVESHATAEAVVHALKSLTDPKRVHPEDRVIIDLVCHGEDTKIPRFLLAPQRVGSQASYLSMAQVRSLFFAIPARHKLLIVDGCRAGTLLSKGGRFDGAEAWQAAKAKPCSVIWCSSQKGANAQSEIGGTAFHRKLTTALDKTTYGQIMLLSTLVDAVGRSAAPAASFGAPNVNMVLAGPESKQAPPIDPREGRQEPTPSDAEGAMRQWVRLQAQIGREVNPKEAELQRRSLNALKHIKAADIAARLPRALEGGDRALVVFTPADHPDEHIEIHRSISYLCGTVGEWKPDKELLTKALVQSNCG